ncbi:MAG: glycosyltransferase family 2 protein [Chitinophagaceae bacterium]|nr:glycosyltransferase family 2 protein [Chitinophagaceae bacterium]
MQNGSNLGYADGYNLGLKAITADYYLLLNNDVEVSPGFLQPIVEAIEANPTVALAQPKLRWLRKPEYFEYAGAAGGLIDRLGYPFCRGRFFDHLEKDEGQYNLNSEVFWASGACLAVKASLFWQLKGFYSYFFMHSEEIDLAWRAQNAGYKILAVGNSSAMHLGAASLGKTNPLKTYYNFRNNLVMCLRNAPVEHLFFLLPARLLLDAAAACFFALKGQWADTLAIGKAWGAAIKWWLTPTDNLKWPGRRGMAKLKGYANRFIVLDYYLKKMKR